MALGDSARAWLTVGVVRLFRDRFGDGGCAVASA